jgi:hypothetical protein
VSDAIDSVKNRRRKSTKARTSETCELAPNEIRAIPKGRCRSSNSSESRRGQREALTSRGRELAIVPACPTALVKPQEVVIVQSHH